MSKSSKSVKKAPSENVSFFASCLDDLRRIVGRITGWKHLYLVACACLPVLLVYLIYLVRGVHPFGDGCVLVLDLNGQYVWFFEALRNFIHGDAELLYSFSRALGGEFLGMYAYYLASPLSFIVCLFPKDRMLEALLCMFLIKTAFCGFSFGYYLRKGPELKNKFTIVLFATCYALCSYAVVMQNNTMWIDAVMWLPLITLGIESLIKYGKFKLYVVSLAIALFSNYYIGYMLCIWCAIYFFVYYLAHAKELRNPFCEKLHFLRSLGRIAGYSLIAIGIAAFIICGAYYSLSFGKTTFSDPKWEVATKFGLLDFLYKLLPGSYDTVRPAGLPFLYCGMLTLLLLPSYFLNQKYPLRQKVCSGILIGILFLSMSINVIDLIWHGFQNPNWLNYRYSFIFCFYLCVLAAKALDEPETVSFRSMIAVGGAITALCVVLQQYTSGDYIDPDDFSCIYFSLILIFAYLAVFAFWRKTDKKALVRNGVLVLVSVELFLSGLFNIIELDMDVGYSEYSTYNGFLDKTRPIVEAVQESDDSFYRMEKTFFRKTNDNMALEIRGLSGSTSTLNKDTIELLKKLGYASRSHWSKYLGGTPVSDSLLGLKYIISDKDIYENYYEVYLTDQENGYTAYKNPYALSIGYGVADGVLDFCYLPEAKEEEEKEPEEGTMDAGFIEDLANGLKVNINNLLGIEENSGEKYLDDHVTPFERLNDMVGTMLGEEEPMSLFVPIETTSERPLVENVTFKDYKTAKEDGYTPKDGQTGSITYEIVVPEDKEVFFYLPTNYPREVKLSLNLNQERVDGGSLRYVSKGTFNANETARIISLGEFKAGDRIKLKITIVKDAVFIYDDPNAPEYYFYYLDQNAFEDAMTRLAEHQLQITDYTESSFEGTYRASRDNDLLMTTIAYDSGWQIWVDGKLTTPEKAFGGFLAFHVGGKAGDVHDIKLVYSPRVVSVGLTISIISLVLFIALILVDRFFFKFGCRDRRPPRLEVGDDAPDACTAVEPKAADPSQAAPPSPNTETDTKRKD